MFKVGTVGRESLKVFLLSTKLFKTGRKLDKEGLFSQPQNIQPDLIVVLTRVEVMSATIDCRVKNVQQPLLSPIKAHCVFQCCGLFWCRSRNLETLPNLVQTSKDSLSDSLCSHYNITGHRVFKSLPKNQLTQRKLFNFEIWINGEVSKSAKL